MLLGRAGKQQQQLQDVLAFHVIPRLGLRDAVALSQTCSTFWQLVQNCLPSTTYRSLVRNTFPAGHPILAVDDANLQAEIRSLAALHASIQSGHAVSATTSCLWKGEPAEYDAPLAPNHQGDRALCQQARRLQLHRLDLSAKRPLQEILWRIPAPEKGGIEENSHRLFWSPDDRWAAIWYSIQDCRDERARRSGWVDAVYVLEMESREIVEVTHTRANDWMLAPIISPDSTLMVIPWTDSTSAIEVYSRSQRRIVARIADLAIHLSTAFHACISSIEPNGTHFAARHADFLRVYRTNGQLQLELKAGQVDDHGNEHAQVAWSPDGCSIAFWQPSTSMLHIFDAAHGFLQGSMTLDMGPDESGADLLWGIYGIIPVLRNNTWGQI